MYTGNTVSTGASVFKGHSLRTQHNTIPPTMDTFGIIVNNAV